MNQTKRNILFITADQWRGDCLSAFGHPCVKTPCFDQLIEDGIAFRNHYTVCAPCGPARASLLTGLYLQNHRSVRNGTPLDDRHNNIAGEVRRAGYRPKLFGYTDTSLDPRVFTQDEVTAHGYESMMPGFEEGLLLPAEEPEKWLEYLRSLGVAVENAEEAFRPVENYPGSKDRGWTFAPPRFSAEQSQTAFLTRSVIDYIDQCNQGDGENWFVHLSYLRPHPPFIAPEPYNSMYDPDEVPMPVRAETLSKQSQEHPWLASALGPRGDWFEPWIQESLSSENYDREMRQIRATYFGLVSKVDHYVGELISFLKSIGQYENTLIIMTSDHGELLGDQWLFGKRGFADGGYKIPLIMKVPEQADETRGTIVDDAFTESVDIMPTILDWLGMEILRQCDGHSLLPFVHDNKPDNWRTEVHWEYDFRDVGDRQMEQELEISMDECQLNVVRDKRYKYVHFTNLPPLFYDLEKDPKETNNLSNDRAYATKIYEMSGKLLSWRMLNDERTLTGMKVSQQGIFSR